MTEDKILKNKNKVIIDDFISRTHNNDLLEEDLRTLIKIIPKHAITKEIKKYIISNSSFLRSCILNKFTEEDMFFMLRNNMKIEHHYCLGCGDEIHARENRGFPIFCNKGGKSSRCKLFYEIKQKLNSKGIVLDKNNIKNAYEVARFLKEINFPLGTLSFVINFWGNTKEIFNGLNLGMRDIDVVSRLADGECVLPYTCPYCKRLIHLDEICVYKKSCRHCLNFSGKEARKKNNIEKFGAESHFSTEDYKNINREKALKAGFKRILEFKNIKPSFTFEEWEGISKKQGLKKESKIYKWECKLCGRVFESRIHSLKHPPECNCFHGPISSKKEYEVYEVLRDIDDEIKLIRNSRSIISPYELDVYIPKHNIAIEFNGLYWHSEEYLSDKKKERASIKDKTDLCKNKGIRLFHIQENVWDNNKDYVLLLLNSLLKNDTEYNIIQTSKTEFNVKYRGFDCFSSVKFIESSKGVFYISIINPIEKFPLSEIINLFNKNNNSINTFLYKKDFLIPVSYDTDNVFYTYKILEAKSLYYNNNGEMVNRKHKKLTVIDSGAALYKNI